MLSSKDSQILALAPMEGVCDFYLRNTITAMGQLDYCVTEFIRVSGQLLPEKVFYRMCPELKHRAKTVSGTPVHVQLLGSDPVLLAENAARVAELGAPVVDLNFGCPAKCVNKHSGGSYLLQFPEQLYALVEAVRSALPASVPLSAKMRLGYEDKALAIENALALEAGGASWLTVHARTKLEGYRPPAHWRYIGKINDGVSIPVVANGEIWSRADAKTCMRESGCKSLMLGRGILSRPDLASLITAPSPKSMTWVEVERIFANYLAMIRDTGPPVKIAGRLKQWLAFLASSYPEASALLAKIKVLKCPEKIYEHLDIT